MCGRYQFSEAEDTAWIADEARRQLGAEAWKPGDVCPGDRAPVLLGALAQPELRLFSWGYPARGKLIINARSETAAEKPLFRDGVSRNRCLIPATGFYEWDDRKRKSLFRLPEAGLLYMGGVYARLEGLLRFCILTTAANDSVSPVHPRMPLVLTAEAAEAWLSGAEAAPLLRTVPPALERRSEEDQLSLW